jgi:hypothetical protein
MLGLKRTILAFERASTQEVPMLQHFVSPSTARLAGNIATLGFLAFIVIQLLLALGIIPVTMAWGGSQTTLTPSLRLASLLATVILGGFAYVIRRRAGLIAQARPSRPIKVLAWVITGLLILGTLGNLASSSQGERLLFTPLSLLLVLACWLVSASKIDE